MKLQIPHIIGIIALFNSVFLSIVILNNKKTPKMQNRIFGALLIIFSILIIYSFMHSIGVAGYFIKYVRGMFLLSQIGFLVGPLMYFYVRSVFRSDFCFKRTDVFHLLPFFAALIYFSIKLYGMENFNPWSSDLKRTYSTLLIFHQVFYFYGIVLEFRKNNQSISKLFTDLKNKKLNLFRILICGYILLWIIKLQSFVLMNVYNRWGFCPYAESMFFLSMFLILNTFMFFALRNSESFFNLRGGSRTVLYKGDMVKAREKLIKCMDSEKPYLDPDLTLPKLAKKLSMQVNSLSQIINDSFNKNFCNFINEYRINESKKQLADMNGSKISIIEIAYNVGFNSKSAFNKAFKKHTGLTPKELKNQINS